MIAESLRAQSRLGPIRTIKEPILERSPSHAEISRHLELLLANPDFEATPPQLALLQYLVRQSLAGQVGRIDADTVAAEVFGRGPDFDPRTDPIARIQTDALRRALMRYYRTAGKNAPLRIDIPPGTYVPTFHNQRPSD